MGCAEEDTEVEEVYERPEDAACGNPCGGEPLMCGRCPELMGETDPPDPYDDDYESYYGRERDDTPCDRCDSPCDHCRVAVADCPCGPALEDRPDYENLLTFSWDPVTKTFPGMLLLSKDMNAAAKECGMEMYCNDPDNCPAWGCD